MSKSTLSRRDFLRASALTAAGLVAAGCAAPAPQAPPAAEQAPATEEPAADAPPGDYLIEVGMYGMTNLRRAYHFDTEGNLAGDRYIMGSVRVAAP